MRYEQSQPPYSKNPPSTSGQLLLKDLLDQLRIRLTARGFHHLTYKPSEGRLLAPTILLNLLGI